MQLYLCIYIYTHVCSLFVSSFKNTINKSKNQMRRRARLAKASSDGTASPPKVPLGEHSKVLSGLGDVFQVVLKIVENIDNTRKLGSRKLGSPKLGSKDVTDGLRWAIEHRLSDDSGMCNRTH